MAFVIAVIVIGFKLPLGQLKQAIFRLVVRLELLDTLQVCGKPFMRVFIDGPLISQNLLDINFIFGIKLLNRSLDMFFNNVSHCYHEFLISLLQDPIIDDLCHLEALLLLEG